MRIPLQAKVLAQRARARTSPRLGARDRGRARHALPRRRARARRRRLAARLHELLRHHDRRRHQRDPAQHPRRARARPGEVEVGGTATDGPAARTSASARTSRCCATRRASSSTRTSPIERLRAAGRRAITTRPTRARCRRRAWDEALWQQMVELGWTGARGARGGRRRGHEDGRASRRSPRRSGARALPSPLIATLRRHRACCARRDAARRAVARAHRRRRSRRRSRSPTPTARGSPATPTSSARRRPATASCSTAPRASCRTRARRRSSSSRRAAPSGVGLYAVPADAPGVDDRARSHRRPDARSGDASTLRRRARRRRGGRRARRRRRRGARARAAGAAHDRRRRHVRRRRVAAADHRRVRASVRTQFDRPIGFFQAVKHPLVNMMLAIDQARSLLYAAACAIDSEPDDALARYARMAKAAASDTARVLLRPLGPAPRRHRLHLGVRRAPLLQAPEAQPDALRRRRLPARQARRVDLTAMNRPRSVEPYPCHRETLAEGSPWTKST